MVAGLRGPIAFATSKLFPNDFGHQNIIAAATSVVVLATILIFGPLTEPTLRWCGIQQGAAESVDTVDVSVCVDEDMNIQPAQDVFSGSVSGGGGERGTSSSNGVYSRILRENTDQDDVLSSLHSTDTNTTTVVPVIDKQILVVRCIMITGIVLMM